jgi:hypothetical protein
MECFTYSQPAPEHGVRDEPHSRGGERSPASGSLAGGREWHASAVLKVVHTRARGLHATCRHSLCFPKRGVRDLKHVLAAGWSRRVSLLCQRAAAVELHRGPESRGPAAGLGRAIRRRAGVTGEAVPLPVVQFLRLLGCSSSAGSVENCVCHRGSCVARRRTSSARGRSGSTGGLHSQRKASNAAPALDVGAGAPR